MKAKDEDHHRKLGKARENPFQSPLREHGPADTSVSDLQPLELSENTVLLYKAPGLWYAVMAATENDYPLWNSSQFTYPDPEPLCFSLQVSLTYPTCHHHLTLSLHQVSLGWLQQLSILSASHLYYTPKQTSFKSRSLLTTKNNKTRQSFLFPLNNRNQLQSPNHGESSHSVLIGSNRPLLPTASYAAIFSCI